MLRRIFVRLDMRPARLAPVALFVAALSLYLSTLTQVHTFDALSYVTSVEQKPWTEVFHPHHLAYGPLGVLALGVGRLLGYTGGAALPLQLLNACAGAAGVALFFVIVRRITRRADLALLAALLLGGAYAYWYYAVEIEVYTVAALFLLICLDLLFRLIEAPSWRQLLWLGLAQGGAILFHQTNVLLCAPVLVVLGADWYRRRNMLAAWRPWLGRWSLYAATLALTVGLPYLAVALLNGFRSWGDFAAWLTEYARTGWWGGPITLKKWADLVSGISDTLAQPDGGFFWLLLLGLVVLRLRSLLPHMRVGVAALLVWLLVYGGFFLWWEPDNIEFWIASLPPLLLLALLALRGARRGGPDLWAAFSIAGIVLAVNHDSIARRGDAATDLQRTISRGLGAQSTPADLLLVPDGLLELYLPYYEQRDNFLSLNQALFDTGDDWGAACAAIHARVDTSLHAGAAVVVSDEFLRPTELLLQRHHLQQAELDQCFARYAGDLRALSLGADLPRYWRIATGEEYAEADGWDFQHFGVGWQLGQSSDEQFADGWSFIPSVDPSLTSPLLHLDSRAYQAIEIRMSNATSARDAQLFVAGPDGSISEEHSLRWQLQPTAQTVTYRIDLSAVPGWVPTITRLRLDPVGVGDGQRVQVAEIRLIRR